MATPALGWDNFFSTTLSGAITASDTTIGLVAAPTAIEGYLVIEPNSSSNREIIYYTGVSGSSVTLPSVGAGRGVGGTSALAHSSGVIVKMNTVAEMFEALKDGTGLSNGVITPSKLDLDPTQAFVTTSETTTSTSFTDLATTTDTTTVTIGANGLALVTIGAFVANNSANSSTMSYDISGANTASAADAYSVHMVGATTVGASHTRLITGLTPGSTTFKLKYKVSGGTGTFQYRRIAVVPL